MSYLRLENRHTGEVLELRRRTQGGEELLELRGTLPPRSEGPPMHIHHFEDEEGLVVAGTLSADIGGKQVQAGPGESVMLPRGIPHRWWNGGDEPLAFRGVVRPIADLDSYLQAMFEVVNAGPPHRPSLFYMAHAALRHRSTQTVLLMPPFIQSVVFRAAVLLGSVLGRYRGSEWPGCPARCTGAPHAVEFDD